jgi:ABC-2 type transport system ATP-binding protein
MQQSDEPAVAIRGVTKTFGAHTAVNNLTVTVPRGAVYGFIGPNGSGKTTTLRMIMHILHPDSGEIEVLGERTTRAAHDRVGYLPEERGLYKSMTVRDVLQFYAGLKGLSRSRPAVDGWIERMGLSEWAGKKVQALSKGMAQKVQFIAAVIAKPELVLLDEPFSGLDPVNLEVLRDAVLDLRRDGTTVIFSTHDMNVAERMCDSIFMIYRGNKVLDGTLDSIQSTYGTDTLHVRLNGDGRIPDNLPGVQKLTDFGRYQELRLAEGVDSQTVLAALMAHGRVLHFELARPSLHDIFVRIAAPEAAGGDHA